jgi:integrase
MRVNIEKRRTKSGISYYADFRIGRKRFRKSLGPNKALAKAQAAQIERAVSLGTYADQGGKKVTVEQFSSEYLAATAHRRRKDTNIEDERRFRLSINPAIGKLLIGGVSSRHIESWVSARRDSGLKPGSVNREMTTLKAMFSTAKRWGYISSSPMDGVKPLPDPRPSERCLSVEEAERLLDACRTGPSHLYGMILVALNTGMRWSEVRFLRWQDLDLVARRIKVENSADHTTKNGKVRYIPMTDPIFDWFSANRSVGLVFRNSDGKPFRQAYRSFKAACAKAGIENLRIHDLRHTYCSHLVMTGAPLQTVMELMGHSSLRMVLRYAHLAQSHISAAVLKLELGGRKKTTELSRNGHSTVEIEDVSASQGS